MQKLTSESLKSLSDGQKLARLAISDTGFLFDPVSGQSFTLNKSGLITLNHLKAGSSIEDTAKDLSQKYKISYELAAASVEAFLIQLGRYI